MADTPIELKGISRGDSKEFKSLFRDKEGELKDPTSVLIQIIDPTATQTNYEWPGDTVVEREAEGTFIYDHLFDMSGPWQIKIQGVGAVSIAEEFYVYVPYEDFAGA